MKSPSSSALGMFLPGPTLLSPAGRCWVLAVPPPLLTSPSLPKPSKIWGPGHRWAGDGMLSSMGVFRGPCR